MENSKQSLDDISGPSRTEQTSGCGSSVPDSPKISTAPFAIGADSQVMKRLNTVLTVHFWSDLF